MLEPERDGIIESLYPQVVELGLPNEFYNPIDESIYLSWYIDGNNFRWAGSMGENMISLDDIERERGSNAPQISDITLALFRNDFDLDNLRHIFVSTIVNKETLRFIKTQLYSEINGIEWPEMESLDEDFTDPMVWEHGTPEYDALLGTRIGKVVAYIVLGGFYRGTTRIARIVSWPSLWVLGSRPNLRFDIESPSPSS